MEMEQSAGVILEAVAAVGGRTRPPSQFSIGEVQSAGQWEDVRIACDGLILTAEDLWVAPELLEGYSPKLVGSLPGTCPDGGTLTPVSADQLTRGELGVKAGDRVVLLTRDGQDYYLVGRMVKP